LVTSRCVTWRAPRGGWCSSQAAAQPARASWRSAGSRPARSKTRTARASAASMMTASAGSRPSTKLTTQSLQAAVPLWQHVSQLIVIAPVAIVAPSGQVRASHLVRRGPSSPMGVSTRHGRLSRWIARGSSSGRHGVFDHVDRRPPAPPARHGFDHLVEDFLLLDRVLPAAREMPELSGPARRRDVETSSVAAARTAVAHGHGANLARPGGRQAMTPAT